MPIYEYQCQSCDHRVEVLQRMADAPLTTCDRCGGQLKKLVSAPAFQFKGDGWYVTDYARKDKGGKGNSSGGSKSGSEGDSSGGDSSSGESSSSASSSDSSSTASDSKSSSSSTSSSESAS